MSTHKVFDEQALLAAIKKTFGGHGAHYEVAFDMLAELTALRAANAELVEALQLAHDQLKHYEPVAPLIRAVLAKHR